MEKPNKPTMIRVTHAEAVEARERAKARRARRDKKRRQELKVSK